MCYRCAGARRRDGSQEQVATETIIIRCAARHRAMGAVTAGGHRSDHFGGSALVHLVDGVLTGVTSGAAIESAEGHALQNGEGGGRVAAPVVPAAAAAGAAAEAAVAAVVAAAQVANSAGKALCER